MFSDVQFILHEKKTYFKSSFSSEMRLLKFNVLQMRNSRFDLI